MKKKFFREIMNEKLYLAKFTQALVENYEQNKSFITCSDASFIPKNGKKTYRVGNFWSGTTKKAEKGLEIITLVLIRLEKDLNLCLYVEQMPTY